MPLFRLYLFQIFSLCLTLYQYGLYIYLLSSFFPLDRSARWYRFLYQLYAPPLDLIRKLTGGRLVIGMFDLSPIVLLILIPFFSQGIAWMLGIT